MPRGYIQNKYLLLIGIGAIVHWLLRARKFYIESIGILIRVNQFADEPTKEWPSLAHPVIRNCASFKVGRQQSTSNRGSRGARLSLRTTYDFPPERYDSEELITCWSGLRAKQRNCVRHFWRHAYVVSSSWNVLVAGQFLRSLPARKRTAVPGGFSTPRASLPIARPLFPEQTGAAHAPLSMPNSRYSRTRNAKYLLDATDVTRPTDINFCDETAPRLYPYALASLKSWELHKDRRPSC